MLLQLFLHLVPVLVIGFVTYMIYCLSAMLREGHGGVFQHIRWILDHSSVLGTFLRYVMPAMIVVLAAVCSFGQISNHIILTLDILYLISTLLLILYHVLKETSNPSVKLV